MNAWTAFTIIVALLIFGAIAWMYLRQRRTGELRQQFGPEYDRELDQQGGRRRAEAELERRTRRVKRLAIRPLPPAERVSYAERWNDQQSRFVDDPMAAVDEVDHLVEEVMERRGYPVAEFEQQAADISVDHPQVVENYRAAHAIALRQQRGEAGTEELRKAMIYYRTLFEELLRDSPATAPAR